METARAVGFTNKTADGRITQYENGARKPKETIAKALADVFGVELSAIDIPNVESYAGVLQTLFYLEDEYGLEIENIDGIAKLKFSGKEAGRLVDDLILWAAEYEKLKNNEITQQEYDEWRYSYPRSNVYKTKKEMNKLRNS